MSSSSYDLLIKISGSLFIIGTLGIPLAFIVCWLKNRFTLAVSLSCACLGLLSLNAGIESLVDYLDLHGCTIVALVIGFVLTFLPVVESYALKSLSVAVNRPPTTVKPIGPILALFTPILWPYVLTGITLLMEYLPLPYYKSATSRLYIIYSVVFAVIIVLLLHRSSLMSQSESQPNHMRWICAFLAAIQFHMTIGLYVYLSFYCGSNDLNWDLSMSTLAFLPIGLFLMALKREYVPEEAQRKITGEQ